LILGFGEPVIDVGLQLRQRDHPPSPDIDPANPASVHLGVKGGTTDTKALSRLRDAEQESAVLRTG
jgi:hypothetical protein